MAKTTANSIPTETAWSSKATLWGKSKQKKGRGIGVATGASDVVSEVHYPNKSNSVMQQNANKNVKCNDNNNTQSHPNTKKRAPSVATSTPQVSQLKSHNALNVKNDNTKSHPNAKKTFAECRNFHTASLPPKDPWRIEREKAAEVSR